MDTIELRDSFERLILKYVANSTRRAELLEYVKNEKNLAVKWLLVELALENTQIDEDDGQLIRDISYWYL
jgi:hypothetical protein